MYAVVDWKSGRVGACGRDEGRDGLCGEGYCFQSCGGVEAVSAIGRERESVCVCLEVMEGEMLTLIVCIHMRSRHMRCISWRIFNLSISMIGLVCSRVVLRKWELRRTFAVSSITMHILAKVAFLSPQYGVQ